MVICTARICSNMAGPTRNPPTYAAMKMAKYANDPIAGDLLQSISKNHCDGVPKRNLGTAYFLHLH